MAKDTDKNPLNNLERMGGGGGGIGASSRIGRDGGFGPRISGMNRSGGGTVNFFGRKVPANQLRLDMSGYPKQVATGPNKGQMQFPSSYGLVGKEKATMFDLARQILRRMGQQ